MSFIMRWKMCATLFGAISIGFISVAPTIYAESCWVGTSTTVEVTCGANEIDTGYSCEPITEVFSCPSGTTGTYPNCTAVVVPTCGDWYTGTYPNCVAITCADYGQTGAYPNCRDYTCEELGNCPPPPTCEDYGLVGIYPGCYTPSCSYTTYSYGSWGSCDVGSNNWNNNSIQCTQTRSEDVGSAIIYGTENCSDDPQSSTTSNSTLQLNSPSQSCGTTVADGINTCSITANISGIPSEWVSWNGRDNVSPSFSEPIYLNQVTNGGQAGGLVFPSAAISGNTLNLSLKSYVPFQKTGYINLASGLSVSAFLNFTKPITANLVATNPPLSIGVSQNFEIQKTNHSAFSPSNIQFSNSSGDPIQPMYPLYHEIIEKTGISNLWDIPSFSATIGARTSDGMSISPGIEVSAPIISYQLDGKNIAYICTTSEDPSDNAKLTFSSANNEHITVLGKVQSSEKAALFSGSLETTTDISISTMRSQIHQSAYSYIRGIQAWTISNGVYYVEGDIRSSSFPTLWGPLNPGFETIVIRNGNLIIDTNINTTKKKFGIIVLSDDDSKGNIYIEPSVNAIFASIYADGSMQSANDQGVTYADSTLQRQIVFYGSIFTNNTIGGAISAGTSYRLPGWATTTSFLDAKKYDLAFLRANNSGYNQWAAVGGTSDYNNGKQTPVVIIYNPETTTNPPIGFSSK